MGNLTYKTTSCSCLPSCNSIKYDFNIDLTRKITNEEIEEMCFWGRPHMQYILETEKSIFELKRITNMSKLRERHVKEMCRSYLRHEYAHVTIRIDGTTYLKRVKSLKYTETDKLSIVGGTLGLFSGFSFIVIFELFYWVVTTVKRLFVKNASQQTSNVTSDNYSTEQMIFQLRQEMAKVTEKLQEKDKEIAQLQQDWMNFQNPKKTENADDTNPNAEPISQNQELSVVDIE